MVRPCATHLHLPVLAQCPGQPMTSGEHPSAAVWTRLTGSARRCHQFENSSSAPNSSAQSTAAAPSMALPVARVRAICRRSSLGEALGPLEDQGGTHPLHPAHSRSLGCSRCSCLQRGRALLLTRPVAGALLQLRQRCRGHLQCFGPRQDSQWRRGLPSRWSVAARRQRGLHDCPRSDIPWSLHQRCPSAACGGAGMKAQLPRVLRVGTQRYRRPRRCRLRRRGANRELPNSGIWAMWRSR